MNFITRKKLIYDYKRCKQEEILLTQSMKITQTKTILRNSYIKLLTQPNLFH